MRTGRNLTIDKVHDLIISYLGRYYKYRNMKDYPLGIMKPKGMTYTEFVVSHMEYSGDYSLNKPFVRDVLHIRDSGLYGGITINDTIMQSPYAVDFNKLVDQHNVKYNRTVPYIDQLAHRDAIQIIPMEARYAASRLDNVTIADVVIRSSGALQPIFCSDGLLSNLHIRDITIETKSQHKVTLGGMVSGSVARIRSASGATIIPVVKPLRLGGGKLNVNVLSFHAESSQQYHIIDGVVDDRRGHHKLNHPYVEYFHYDRFQELYAKSTAERFVRIQQTLNIMNTEGTCIYKK